MYFKVCPRCETGTLVEESDMWGRFLSCLHCGFVLYMEEDDDAWSALQAAAAQDDEDDARKIAAGQQQ